MTEPVRRVLAYQQTPAIVTCQQSGDLPEDFLVSLTSDECEYVRARSVSMIEPIFYEVLPCIGAAGILSGASPVLVDVHATHPTIFVHVDGIALPLAEDPATQRHIRHEYIVPYHEAVQDTVRKTTERFGSAHLIHLSVLPHFHEGRLVTHDIITFGTPLLQGAAHEPTEFWEQYEKLLVAQYPVHTWVGINPRLFATRTLRKEVVDRLGRIRTALIARQE